MECERKFPAGSQSLSLSLARNDNVYPFGRGRSVPRPCQSQTSDRRAMLTLLRGALLDRSRIWRMACAAADEPMIAVASFSRLGGRQRQDMVVCTRYDIQVLG